MYNQLSLPLPTASAPLFYQVELRRDDQLLHTSCLLDHDVDALDYQRSLVYKYLNVSWEPEPRPSGDWLGLATDGERGHVYRCEIRRQGSPENGPERS